MGLALSVGILADLKANDPEGFKDFVGFFDSLNEFLKSIDLEVHNEPLDIEVWDAEMFGYSGLHRLRRLAAYIDSGLELPGPGGIHSSKDETLEAYFDDVIGKRTGFIGLLIRRKKKFRREFDHLIVHSDAEGFYLPVDFPNVLIASDDIEVPGGMVGSVPRLLSECERLARILNIPSSLTSDSEELWDAADTQGDGDVLWEQYGVESFTCVALNEACRRSIETGAAIVFT